jgi:hypothetical protein
MPTSWLLDCTHQTQPCLILFLFVKKKNPCMIPTEDIIGSTLFDHQGYKSCGNGAYQISLQLGLRGAWGSSWWSAFASGLWNKMHVPMNPKTKKFHDFSIPLQEAMSPTWPYRKTVKVWSILYTTSTFRLARPHTAGRLVTVRMMARAHAVRATREGKTL